MKLLLGSVSHPLLDLKAQRPGLANILYAEDDPALRRTHTLALTHEGYTVTAVEDGLQAWEALQLGRYDLLITDNGMPRLTGLELAATARGANMDIPIILACGSEKSYVGRIYDWLHLAAHLPKPSAPGEFLATVKRVLQDASGTRSRIAAPDAHLAASLYGITPYQHSGLNE